MQQETGGNIAVRVKDYTVHVDFFLSLRNITDTREGIDRREAKKKKKNLILLPLYRSNEYESRIQHLLILNFA